MRVALIHPHLFHHPAPSLPSGLAWLAAMLRARGHRVRLLDLSFVWNRSRAIPRFLAEVEPDVIALGVPYLDNDCAYHALSFLPGTRWVADALRASCRAPIVAGGWGVTRAPLDTLRYLGLPLGFVGGDLGRSADWLEAVANGSAEAEIPGSVRWDGVAYRATPAVPDPVRTAFYPAAGAHDLIAISRHEAHGGAAVIPVAFSQGAAPCRREAAEIDHELGVLQATSRARRVLFAGLRVGADPEADDGLLERLAMRGPALGWEMDARPGAVTVERMAVAARAGARALRLRLENPDEQDLLLRAVERVLGTIPVLVELCLGGPTETIHSMARTLRAVSVLSERRVRLVLRPGSRLWSPAGDDAYERRSSGAGDSYVWPRFGFARATAGSLRDRLRSASAARPGVSVDSDAYAPWQRLAHAASRRSGVWPAWTLDRHVADVGKRLRGGLIERVPFRN